MKDLKDPLQKIVLKHRLEKVENQPGKAFLHYSRKNDEWIVSGSLSFSKKLAMRLGLNDGGYSKAPFNPKSHNIASPGQRVRLEDMVERLEKSQRQTLNQINFDEMLNSGAVGDDDDEPPPFIPDPPPEAASVLSPVAPQNPVPKALAPPKPPRKPKPDACVQVILNEPPAVVPDRPDNGISPGNATDRAFDELFNSDPTLAQMSAAAIEKKFYETFKDELSPRLTDILKEKNSTQVDFVDDRRVINKGKVSELTSFWNSNPFNRAATKT